MIFEFQGKRLAVFARRISEVLRCNTDTAFLGKSEPGIESVILVTIVTMGVFARFARGFEIA